MRRKMIDLRFRRMDIPVRRYCGSVRRPATTKEICVSVGWTFSSVVCLVCRGSDKNVQATEVQYKLWTHGESVMTSEGVNEKDLGTLPLSGDAGVCSMSSLLSNEFNWPPANSDSDGPFDFQWSTQHYRVYQLVRAFCEQTKSNFETGE